MKVIRIPKEDYLDIEENNLEDEIIDYATFCTLKGWLEPRADLFEIVRVDVDGVPLLMLVDEEGRLNGLEINLRASMLYGSPCGICGDVLVCAEYEQDRSEIRCLNDKEVAHLKAIFE